MSELGVEMDVEAGSPARDEATAGASHAPSVTTTSGPDAVPPALVAVAVVAGAALLTGVLLRVWLLVHLPVFGDEAVVGLMARAIGSGHFSAFYWGQSYGGVEPYVAAALLKVGGGGAPALNATPALLAALAAFLVAAITLAAGRGRLLALAAGSAAWVWPYVAVWGSVRELGFRFATLCCGLAAIACCVRIASHVAGRLTFLAFGLALGLGWWACPEIVYFALPCLVLLVGWWRSTTVSANPIAAGGPDAAPRRRSLLVVAGGLALGSLPWWLANVHTRFASLRHSALPDNGGVGYGAKLSVFFHEMLPMQLGVRAVLSGDWVGGPLLGPALYVVILVLVAVAVVRALWLAVGEPRRVPAALALAVVGYPFIYAAAPGTGYWNDGRYGLYLPFLVVALFGTVLAAPATAPRRHAATRGAPDRRVPAWALALAACGLAGATALTVAGARADGVPAPSGFFAGWHDGNAPMEQVLGAMRAHHITDAYGDYWTAYDLDFLSGGHPLVSPSVLDVTRSASLADGVAGSADPAWLFFAPGQTAQATSAFDNPQPGPGPYTEQTFEARLRQRAIPFRVVHLGILDAVVPARRVVVP